MPMKRFAAMGVCWGSGGGDGIFLGNVPRQVSLAWRGGWIARMGSEGTRPAPLPAGPVPERWHVKSVFIETPDGPAISCTSLLGLFSFSRKANAERISVTRRRDALG